jgi:hypothetical protein
VAGTIGSNFVDFDSSINDNFLALLVTMVGLAAALYLRLTPPVDTLVYPSTILPPANLSGGIPSSKPR